jgi:hypothetical protein
MTIQFDAYPEDMIDAEFDYMKNQIKVCTDLKTLENLKQELEDLGFNQLIPMIEAKFKDLRPTRHIWENMAKPPYELVGISTPEMRESEQAQRRAEGKVYTTNTRGGGTCNWCGRAIEIKVYFRGSCGKKFYVGSDCAESAGMKGHRLDDLLTKHRKQVADKRKQSKEQLATEARKWVRENRQALEALPHPKGWENKTAYDYVSYFGVMGADKYLKLITEVKSWVLNGNVKPLYLTIDADTASKDEIKSALTRARKDGLIKCKLNQSLDKLRDVLKSIQ